MQHAVDKLQTQINHYSSLAKELETHSQPGKVHIHQTWKKRAQKYLITTHQQHSYSMENNRQIPWSSPGQQVDIPSSHYWNRNQGKTYQSSLIPNNQSPQSYPTTIKTKHIPNVCEVRLVRTIFTYSGPAWGAQLSLTSWKKLEAVQNIALRSITGSPWYVRNTTIQASMHMTSVQQSVTKDANNMHAKLVTY